MSRDGVKPFLWPTDALPWILYGGLFWNDDRDFGFVHRLADHALHVHHCTGIMRVEGRDRPLRPGDVTFTRAGTHFAFHLPRTGQHWCVRFLESEPSPGDWKPGRRRSRATPPRLGRAVARQRQMIELPQHGSLGVHWETVAQRLAHLISLTERSNRDELARAAASAALQSLVLEIVMILRGTETRRAGEDAAADMWAGRAADLIRQRFADDLSIPRIARDVGIGQNYLARCFRRRFGMTMPHFVLNCRAEHARELLATTALPIKHIADRVGMPDVQHFSKQFRRLTGASPSEIRRMATISRETGKRGPQSPA